MSNIGNKLKRWLNIFKNLLNYYKLVHVLLAKIIKIKWGLHLKDAKLRVIL